MTSFKLILVALGMAGLGAAVLRPTEQRRALTGTRAIAEAVDAYRTENHGACPRSIDELVTERFLAHVPIDPWGQAYRLKCGESGCDIWSKGKNTVDGDGDDIRTEVPIL